MFFKQFLRDDLGCASYMIGDADAGECVVVDPQWDVAEYVKTAEQKGLHIGYVIETHNHADHVSGHGKLAQLGAKIAVHEDAGVDYPSIALKDGDTMWIGKVRIGVLHTPGHRPEHIALSVTDTTRAQEPWLVLTGDALFVGDVGRPDLAIEPEEGAAQLYNSLKSKLLGLPDGVEVYPAHVAGSLCGKAMSAKESSTIGFERLYNRPLAALDSEDFVREVTSELPPQPPQFGRIVAKNRGPLLTEDPILRSINADELEAMRKDGALVLDTRSPEAFGAGHIPGALNVHKDGGQFGVRAAWVIPPDTSVALVLEKPEDLASAASSLFATGQDRVAGFLDGGMQAWDKGGFPLETVSQISASELHERLQTMEISSQLSAVSYQPPAISVEPTADSRQPIANVHRPSSITLVDVREKSEWREGHIPGAVHIPFHQLSAQLDELPSNKPVIIICGGGARSSIAASILQAQGFEPVNITDGMNAWKIAGYELET